MASTLANLTVHIVFSTKDRQACILDEYQSKLYAYIGGIARNVDIKLLAIGGMPDHIHLLIAYRSHQTISEIVKKLKANSLKWINEQRFLSTKFVWQSGYGAFSVSHSKIDVVKNYILNQAAHHKKQTYNNELLELLEKHNVDYDPKYL